MAVVGPVALQAPAPAPPGSVDPVPVNEFSYVLAYDYDQFFNTDGDHVVVGGSAKVDVSNWWRSCHHCRRVWPAAHLQQSPALMPFIKTASEAPHRLGIAIVTYWHCGQLNCRGLYVLKMQ
jgi:hypothetical protein